MAGGHSGYGFDYLQTSDPISDVSMRVQGPAAGSANRFTDLLWRFACAQRASSLTAPSVSLAQTAAAGACPAEPGMPAPPATPARPRPATGPTRASR